MMKTEAVYKTASVLGITRLGSGRRENCNKTDAGLMAGVSILETSNL
jgi:hypothetical protein